MLRLGEALKKALEVREVCQLRRGEVRHGQGEEADDGTGRTCVDDGCRGGRVSGEGETLRTHAVATAEAAAATAAARAARLRRL